MPSKINLSELDKLASVLYIIGAIIVITAANKTEQTELTGQDTGGPSTTELITAASTFFLTANLIFYRNSTVRLKQDQQAVQSGQSDSSLFPSLLTTTGWILSVLGGTLRLIGHKMELKEEASK